MTCSYVGLIPRNVPAFFVVPEPSSELDFAFVSCVRHEPHITSSLVLET